MADTDFSKWLAQHNLSDIEKKLADECIETVIIFQLVCLHDMKFTPEHTVRIQHALDQTQLSFRADATSYVSKFGNSRWKAGDALHNNNGPAVICGRRKEWWVGGVRHRIGGAAETEIYDDGEEYPESYWINGIQYSYMQLTPGGSDFERARDAYIEIHPDEVPMIKAARGVTERSFGI